MWPPYSGRSDAAPDTTYMAQPAAALPWLKLWDDGGSFVFVYTVYTCSPSWDLFPASNVTEGCCRATWSLWRWHPLFTFYVNLFFWWLLLVQLVRWKAVWSHVVAHVILRTWERPCNVSTVTPALITSSLYLSWAVAHLCSFSRIMLFSYCILWRSHHFCSFHSSMHCNCNHYKWATLYNTLRKLPCEREGQAKNVFILDFWVEH